MPDRPTHSTRRFVVLDETTGRRYAWNIWPPGSTTIGVPTTWTLLHRGWADHVFVLVEEPKGFGRTKQPSIANNDGMHRRLLDWLRSHVL